MIYFDKSLLQNPVLEYFSWIIMKIKYQLKYWGKHLRIGYKSKVYNVQFGRYNWIVNDVIIENSSLGDFSYVSSNSVILEAQIGKFCSIGPNVRIAPGKHPTHTIVSTHPAIFSNPSYSLKNFSKIDRHNPNRKVVIGNDVWICANAVIADGVTIGDGAIIGANCVVTKNVEPYSIVGGLPGKHIRFRFEPAEIEHLLNTQWWNRDLKWIEENIAHLWDIKNYINNVK